MELSCNVSAVTVADIMTPNPVTVTRLHKVDEVMELFQVKGISGAPVVDNQGVVIGVVTLYDLLLLAGMGKQALCLGELPLSVKVEKPVITLTPDAPLRKALVLILKEHVGRLVIIDEFGKPLGVVTRRNLLQYYLRCR